MAMLKLRNKKVKTMSVDIGGDVYKIPLAGSMSIKDLNLAETAEGTLEWLKKYIPDDVVDSLARDDYNLLVNTWAEESKKDSDGASVGE